MPNSLLYTLIFKKKSLEKFEFGKDSKRIKIKAGVVNKNLNCGDSFLAHRFVSFMRLKLHLKEF